MHAVFFHAVTTCLEARGAIVHGPTDQHHPKVGEASGLVVRECIVLILVAFELKSHLEALLSAILRFFFILLPLFYCL